MAKIMIWPDVQREDGHWLPAVTLAKSLKDAGHTVQMMGIPDTKAIADLHQVPFTQVLADFFPLGYARERLETGRVELSHLLAIARGDLNSVFNVTPPFNLLIGGYFASLEALILHYKYNLKLVSFTTFLRHPNALPALLAKSTLVNLPPAVAAKLIGLATGNSSMSIDKFIEPLFKPKVREMIPMPKDFDFVDKDWKHDETRISYVEPMVERMLFNGGPVPPQPAEYFPELPATGRILLGAAGSQVEVFEASARHFFVSLIDMMKTPGFEQRRLVLALGAMLYQEFGKIYSLSGGGGNRLLPPNVHLAPWVPQLELLTRTDVVFLHGGLATIKESMFRGVPIVITPMVNDQFENALRLERLDLGVMAPLDRLTPDSLREAFTEVTSGKWFSRARLKMQQTLVAADTAPSKRSVQVVQEVLTSQP